jgi:hypothetical protein
MTKGQLLKAMEAIPLNAEITIGKCVVINEKRKLFGILELPVSGFGYDRCTNELHFLLNLEHVKQIFCPSELTLLKNIPSAEHNFHNPEIHDVDEGPEHWGRL